MSIGLLQAGRLAVLQAQVKDDKMVKLKTLLESQGMGAVGYAWAWSFCHFLLHTPRYEKRFKKYFLAISRDKSITRIPRVLKFKQLSADEARDSLLRFLKVKDVEALQAEWYTYIRESLSLDRNEMDWGQAGFVMKMYGEDAKARKFFKRAIDRGSTEAYVHYNYAELKQRQKMPGIALKYAKKACEFDPLHAAAWSLQGQALRSQGEAEEGLRLLKLGAEMDPENSNLWLALTLAEQAGKKDEEKEGE